MVLAAPQHAQYSPTHFHSVGTFSTLSWCRNCSMFSWCRNILWCSMHPNMLSTTLLTSTMQDIFHTSTMQEPLSQNIKVFKISLTGFNSMAIVQSQFLFQNVKCLKMSNVSKYLSQDSIRRRSFSLDFYLKMSSFSKYVSQDSIQIRSFSPTFSKLLSFFKVSPLNQSYIIAMF